MVMRTMITFVAWFIVYHIFAVIQTVGAAQISGFIKSNGGRYLISTCQQKGGLKTFDNYIMHSGHNLQHCGTQFTMNFKPNGKVTFMIIEHNLSGQYLCLSSAGNYITHCRTPYDFNYIQVSSTSYGGTYKFGWNGKYSLNWSNEIADNSCKNPGHMFLKAAGFSMQNGPLFHVFEPAKFGNSRTCIVGKS
ncbi:hypothetical protein BCR42DRAFT_427155 [Absidia repens]|uniref:Uncharacterized protein n=1 Tax=Absidia repens TaxID=90262 RepID=A0A1X2HZZ2_9FUNG|nr:hypothetical protein BCR42DRAFT_427155 [Absidia repens]